MRNWGGLFPVSLPHNPQLPRQESESHALAQGEGSLTGGIEHHQQRLLFLLQEPSEVLRHKQRTPQVTHCLISEAHPPGATVVGGAGETCRNPLSDLGSGVRDMACQEPKEPQRPSLLNHPCLLHMGKLRP